MTKKYNRNWVPFSTQAKRTSAAGFLRFHLVTLIEDDGKNQNNDHNQRDEDVNAQERRFP
jgi:hypothetical protein